MLWSPSFHRRIVQLADGIVVIFSFILSYLIWNWLFLNTSLKIGRPFQINENSFFKITIYSILWVIIFDMLKAYEYQRFTSLIKEFSIIFKVTIIGVFLIFSSHFVFRFQYIQRSYLIIFLVSSFLMFIVEKTVLFKVAKLVRKKGKDRKNVLIIGTGEIAKKFSDTIDKNIEWGLNVIGYLDDNGDKRDWTKKKYLGSSDEIEKVLHENLVDEVILCISDYITDKVKNIVAICEIEGVQLRMVSDFFGSIARKIRADNIYGLPIISIVSNPCSEWALYLKRLMDIVISAVLLFLLAPLFVIISALIKYSSRGPVFYVWNVVGKNKKPFTSWKFRTMIENADELKVELKKRNEMSGPVFKIKGDPRITKIGKILRKFSLDELPQLLSVLKGDMSLVGPRPPLRSELSAFDNWHRRKLSVKPGITCLWQVKGRNEIVAFDEWARLDLEYIDNWSLWLDFKIIFFTFIAVFRGTGR